jgi:hypothetical protein
LTNVNSSNKELGREGDLGPGLDVAHVLPG